MCQFGRARAIDAPPPFVLSFQPFEGEKSFESPVMPNGLRVAVPYKVCPYRCRLGDRRWQVEAGQVNVVHVSSFSRNG